MRRAFEAVQELIDRDLVLAGHDVSDGGLVTTLLEMAFSGNCGIDVEIGDERALAEVSRGLAGDSFAARPHPRLIPSQLLFAEELGLVIECRAADAAAICAELTKADVPCVLHRADPQGEDRRHPRRTAPRSSPRTCASCAPSGRRRATGSSASR